MRKQKTLQIVLHIIGCLLFLALPIFTSPDFPQSASFLNQPTQRDLLGYLLMTCFFYLNFFLLIPKFYFTGKYLSFFSIILLCFAIVCAIPRLVFPEKNFNEPPGNFYAFHDSNQIKFHHPPPGENIPPPPPENNRNHTSHAQPNNYVFTIVRYLFVFLALVFFSLILQVNNRLKLVEKERLNTELRFLKAQINPHFLFNSLNTIYSLSITEKSTSTSAAVIRLSEMMRYVINETGKDFVLLQDEINYVSNYIALQKMRFDDLVDINFNQHGTTTGKKIAPLILIPFIENAFKYGVDAQEKSIININLDNNDDNLHLLVENKKVNVKPVESSGVGLLNTQSRLQLLYPAKHELVIHDDENFSVSLTLVLS